jgi:hypothetical protein
VARLASLMVLALVAACGGDRARSGDPASANPAPAALDAITADRLMNDIRILSSDSLQGRLPGSLGEERTVAFLESEFKARRSRWSGSRRTRARAWS